MIVLCFHFKSLKKNKIWQAKQALLHLKLPLETHKTNNFRHLT
jgi:hypothetical protein